jgi:peptidoglycan/LPS O-acetylase OafA/YrhL
MKNNTIKIGVALVLVFFLVTLADLVPFWMPKMNEMMLLLIVSVLLLVWASFVMFEQVADEREAVHRMDAGRIAYLSGIGVLTLALIVQGFSHTIDPWISISLCTMVLSKLAARLYFDTYR